MTIFTNAAKFPGIYLSCPSSCHTMAEGNEREERLRDVLRRLRREENEEGTERRNEESEREEERATQVR